MKTRCLCYSALGLLALSGCGSRPDAYDAPIALPLRTHGLTGAVAVFDAPLDRVVMLGVPTPDRLQTRAISTGKNVVASAVSPDASQLFVLSRGVVPRRTPSDERPSLSLIDGGLSPRQLARWELTDPLSGLAIDPQGEYAVVYAADGVVENPNELIIVDLRDPTSTPVSRTLKSRGGKPQRLTFTTALTPPRGEARRFLIVETEKDLSFLELARPERTEVNVTLPRASGGGSGRPAEVRYDDGDPARSDDARIAVRLEGDRSVVLLELAPPPDEDTERDFKTTVNVVDVGGVPSAIDFVRTDGGLRLAALVPNNGAAVLIDPATSVAVEVELPRSYSRLTRVTESLLEKPDRGDVALLYSESASGVAFWSLGRTTGTPYRSVEAYDLDIAVAQVLDVPGQTNAGLKLLANSGTSQFFVFDLDARTSSPLLTESTGFSLSLSPDGERAWAVRPGSARFAQLDLTTLHPTSLEAEREVSAVHDVARADGGRAAIALHVSSALGSTSGALAATVLDAREPDTARSSFHTGLLLGGLR